MSSALLLPQDWGEHVICRHGIRPVYRCIKCDRESGHLHSLRCHAGRCDGSAFRALAPSPVPASFKCDHCSRSFLTAIGRSQHVWHKHPVVANARRIAARLEEIAKKRADRAAAAEAIGQRRRGCWSDEEVAVLVKKEFELMKTGVKQINAAIARFLPGKTAKQVGSKRAVLAKRAHKSHQGSEQSTTTTNSQSQIGREPQSSSDWRDLFPGSASPGHTCWSAVFSEALLELVEDGTAIAWGSFENAIEDWVEHYKSRREVTNNRRNLDSDRHTSNLYKSSSRRRDKRQAYARHQDLFRKNRKKLLAVVLGENRKRECPIPIYAIEEFYKNRLSAPGPEVDLKKYPSSSQVENDYLESVLRGGD
ncbi:transcriptase [Octopus vulgaris]|uniref:Transcriptase n=1 Tax=Octopus vulgaris TaxID=6645 RepID=A0AA36BLD6_OCTVU|nr:transcriptase [Octopus vulgaris]